MRKKSYGNLLISIKYMTKRKFKKGDSYRPIVRVEKAKKDVPTVITMSGRTYTLRHKHQYKKGENK